MYHAIRVPMLACLAVMLIGLAVTGCQSPQDYRNEADEVAYDAIAEGQERALGRTEPFTIETPADTLRQRLIVGQNLPIAAPASLGTEKLEAIPHWPDDDYLTRQRPDADDPLMGEATDQAVTLTLVDALQVAAGNSRDYQTQKERVFTAALALDLQRDAFRNSVMGAIDSLFTHDRSGGGEETGVEHTAALDIDRKLKNGVSISSRIAFDLAYLLTHGRPSAKGIFADVTISIPLLAGSGRHVVTEPLTQAERNVLYELWSFERFKRTFAVSVASDYLSVIEQLDRVDNARGNYRRLIESLERSRALADEGRLSEIGVDQVRQDVLRARNDWINARMRYARLLDEYKVTLGLPADAAVVLDPDELTRLASGAGAALPDASTGDPSAGEYKIDEQGRVTILDVDTGQGGPLELPPAAAIGIALGRRLDLRTDLYQVADAQRKVTVIASDLKPGLNVTVGASAGGSVSSGASSDADLRPEEGTYTLGLDFDLPWEKVPERNDYRESLIDLEQAVRSLQSTEDRVKLEVRDRLRSLRQAREGYRTQARAVAVAERRVESSNLFFELGRAAIRDVLEAQEDLIDAQNALTSALVSYRVNALALQRDMGVLEVDDRGLWNEYDPQGDVGDELDEAIDGNMP